MPKSFSDNRKTKSESYQDIELEGFGNPASSAAILLSSIRAALSGKDVLSAAKRSVAVAEARTSNLEPLNFAEPSNLTLLQI